VEILSNVWASGGGTMNSHSMNGASRRFVAGGLALLLVACATTGSSRHRAASGNRRARAATAAPRTFTAPPGWRVSTLEHVDLWLHGFALLTSDTGGVPFFARGYKQEVTALKRKQNLYTQLDANQPNLSARFATNPSLANAQFIAMYFSSFQEIVTATDLFIRSSGDPRASRDPQMQQNIAILASNFPQQADRNWLRLFVQSLQDENTKFFHAYWTGEQQARGAAYAAFQEQWMSVHYPKLSRFLNNTQQSAGQLVLSVPLGGEGRTVNDGKQSNMIAVEFPRTVDAAPEALFGFVHEAIARLVDEAITDNSTPAEQRSGATAGYVGNGAVRGGALLLQKIEPTLVADYMRFYLRARGVAVPTGDVAPAFAAAFPLPAAILTAIGKQIDVVMGGI
jgi:hypothetical protein